VDLTEVAGLGGRAGEGGGDAGDDAGYQQCDREEDTEVLQESS
jgi:hypothetical protein